MKRWRRAIVLPLLLPAACGGPVEPPAPIAARPLSCAEERGDDAARILANRCRLVSPATRPPCHPANSCEMIEAEIERSCIGLGIDVGECFGPTERSRQGEIYSRPITPP